MLTDKTIAQAFIDAKERGVCVEIIANGDSSKEKFSKITLLQNAGIAVYVYEPENKNSMFSEIMHHKFIIFKKNTHDKALLWTGSFNLTKSANERNHENVIIVEEPGLVRKYDKKFDQLKEMILKHKEALTKKYAHRKNKRSHKKTDEMYCC